MANQKTVTTEDLSAQVDQLKNDIAGLTKTISDLGRARGDQMAASVKDHAHAAKEAGEAHLADLQNSALRTAESAEDYVKRNPATALGIAAGFGFLVGFLGSRR